MKTGILESKALMMYTFSSVTARGVTAMSRALFMLTAALLVPLVVQHVFGVRADASTLGIAVVSGAMVSLLVSRAVLRAPERSNVRAALGLWVRSLGLGMLGGGFAAMLWASTTTRGGSDRYLVAPLFGAIYGLGVGAALGSTFALWSARARAAIATPSTLAAQRLTMEAGFALTLAGALGVWAYRIESFQVASIAASVLGAGMIVVALLRVMKVHTLLGALSGANPTMQLLPRANGSIAPALAWAPRLDQVIVRADGTSQIEPGPFRALNPAAEIAAVPADLSLVRSAIGRAVGFGIAALSVSGLAHLGVVALQYCSSDCGCSH